MNWFQRMLHLSVPEGPVMKARCALAFTTNITCLHKAMHALISVSQGDLIQSIASNSRRCSERKLNCLAILL